MAKLILVLLIALISNLTFGCWKYYCSDVGGQQVCYDMRCSAGESLGCNAGGQGERCRFCGFGQFPPNHIIFELNEDGAGLKAVDFYCDVGQALCVCDSAMKCATEVITESAFDHNLKVMLNCPQPGQCTVDGKILKTSAKFKDIRYVSCNKCATEVKLDNSPPLKPCLQTAEELGKLDIASCTLRADVPHQMCEVDDDAEVVNRIVVDYTTPFYLFYPDTNRRTVSVDACTPMGPSESDVAESVDRTPSTKTTKRPTPNTEAPSRNHTTTTTISVSTKAPKETCPAPMKSPKTNSDYKVNFNGKNIVVISDPENIASYPSDTRTFSRKTEFRNHIVFEFDEDKANENEFFRCEHNDICVCDGNNMCTTSATTSLYVYLECPAKGQCTVNAKKDADGKENVHQNIHYLSCQKECGTKVKLDNSPPLRPCYQTAKDLEKLDSDTCSIGDKKMCEVADGEEVANKLVYDFTFPSFYYISKNTKRCRYASGVDLITYKRQEDQEKTTIVSFHDGGCIGTDEGNFYEFKGQFEVKQFCPPTGKCTLYGHIGIVGEAITSVNDPTKTYTKKMQNKAEEQGKKLNDPTAYLQNVSWVSPGHCLPRTCDTHH
ncbi:hypothetical protein QR680_011790 [Steinernema hermaphroditum]|uniref:Uncharacterized protein n=1 Tax=Steinernema hermaphroditum TaxID=289476 RepID=A0AA39I219_9BILA|nr:hypothetical protein QR680_011790 [Steinernema hermaphroditum]